MNYDIKDFKYMNKEFYNDIVEKAIVEHPDVIAGAWAND